MLLKLNHYSADNNVDSVIGKPDHEESKNSGSDLNCSTVKEEQGKSSSSKDHLGGASKSINSVTQLANSNNTIQSKKKNLQNWTIAGVERQQKIKICKKKNIF